MDLRSPNKYLQAFVDAGREAGFPINDDFNGAEQEGIGPYQVTHKNGERFSAAKAYLTPNLGRKNLTVFTEAHTTRILFEGKRATGVEFRRAGRLEQIGANHEVLMAAGALQTPQILMLSGVGPAARAARSTASASIHDLPGVGRNLHDHVDAVQVVDAPQLKETFGVSLGGIAPRAQGDPASGAASAAACSPPTSPRPAASSRARRPRPSPTCSCTSWSASWSTTAARRCSATATRRTCACCGRRAAAASRWPAPTRSPRRASTRTSSTIPTTCSAWCAASA